MRRGREGSLGLAGAWRSQAWREGFFTHLFTLRDRVGRKCLKCRSGERAESGREIGHPGQIAPLQALGLAGMYLRYAKC
jgi:hypothetical protein